jgi:hypothetical protein
LIGVVDANWTELSRNPSFLLSSLLPYSSSLSLSHVLFSLSLSHFCACAWGTERKMRRGGRKERKGGEESDLRERREKKRKKREKRGGGAARGILGE